MEAEMAYISDELDRARVYFQRALSLEPEVGWPNCMQFLV